MAARSSLATFEQIVGKKRDVCLEAIGAEVGCRLRGHRRAQCGGQQRSGEERDARA